MVPKKSGSREIIKILEDDGWYSASVRGDHHYFERAMKEGKVKVPILEKRCSPENCKEYLQAGEY